jgi:hypothetical protein
MGVPDGDFTMATARDGLSSMGITKAYFRLWDLTDMFDIGQVKRKKKVKSRSSVKYDSISKEVRALLQCSMWFNSANQSAELFSWKPFIWGKRALLASSSDNHTILTSFSSAIASPCRSIYTYQIAYRF